CLKIKTEGLSCELVQWNARKGRCGGVRRSEGRRIEAKVVTKNGFCEQERRVERTDFNTEVKLSSADGSWGFPAAKRKAAFRFCVIYVLFA
ncbi:hypothetical protein, partial [Sporosarcina beigongshangi]|uniref:hypothetical protein n=1 Tax=Sporosarcina beigongshangi TaxID=2782538 RepID=UPI002ACEF481